MTSQNLHPAIWSDYAQCNIMSVMEKKRHYLREWRKHRKLTQEDVLNRLAMAEDELLPGTAASLSRIENGKQPYNERILDALADVYQTEDWRLLKDNPLIESEVVEMPTGLSAAARKHVEALIKTLEKDAG